ncbi:MAG: hypothetical protein DRG78_22075 [Epsilonproteobacteria bacterium]|nr:MAG: hypothetical protein DRG78_22075 [Campylobacterota bacterium]
MKVNKEWISIADMMAGLMMVFMFIAVVYMVEVSKEQETIKEIAMTYREAQQDLNADLQKEFKKDLQKWDAKILKDNTIRFKSPDVLFKGGSSDISPAFRAILDDFFPRYIKIMTSDKYKNNIDEIRIEGHTSSIWGNAKSKKQRYLKNMALSQDRSKSVLAYCFSMNDVNQTSDDWMIQSLRANGMAFSKVLYKNNGKEDTRKSQRVEFKVLTKAEEKIYKIIEKIG